MPSATGIQVFNSSDLSRPCDVPKLLALYQRDLLTQSQLEHGTTVKCFKSKRVGAGPDLKTLFRQIHGSDLFLEIPVGTVFMEEASDSSNVHKLVVYQFPLAAADDILFNPLCKQDWLRSIHLSSGKGMTKRLICS